MAEHTDRILTVIYNEKTNKFEVVGISDIVSSGFATAPENMQKCERAFRINLDSLLPTDESIAPIQVEIHYSEGEG